MEAVLRVEGLTVAFPAGGAEQIVVDGLSLEIRPREVLALVGESGCGKTMTALAILGLVPPPGKTAGDIYFQGRLLRDLSGRQWRRIRGRGIGLIFQEPASALNPLLRVGTQMAEGMQAHFGWKRRRAWQRGAQLLAELDLKQPERCMRLYPHQLSGGMRQRVLIAMALALEPELLIADEPTSSVDSLTQLETVRLLRRVREQRNLSILLISHDLGVVMEMADRLALMRQGRVVESGPTRDLLTRPAHPYTAQFIELFRSLEMIDGTMLGLGREETV